MPPSRKKPSSGVAGIPWDQVGLAPVVLVSGTESLLAQRAVDRLRELATDRDESVEVTRLTAGAYRGGELTVVTSPSLFEESRLVVMEGAEQLTEELAADLLTYVAAPREDVVLVVQHGGGQRGKKVLDAIRAAGHPVVQCDPIRRDADKAAFVTAELRAAGRRAEPAAVRALLEAVGSDLRELAAACAQLVADTTGPIGEATVRRYHGGRVEATGFRVADAAVAGRAGDAVSLLRHALATGADPVPLVAILATKLRTLALVAASRGRGGERDLGLASWQVDRARRELARWTPEGLASAITAVAQADAEVKGGGRDPVFAVERAVLRVAAGGAS